MRWRVWEPSRPRPAVPSWRLRRPSCWVVDPGRKLPTLEIGSRWRPKRSGAGDHCAAVLGASWLGLALPRILLRNPYGKRTDPVEAFDFEEIADVHEHEAFLWGNPAFACAQLLGAAFEEQGWSLQPGERLEIDDLPAYTYQEDGESRLLPCAELCLTERAAEAILERGLMPLMSYKNRDAVRLARFQSLAFPPAPLRGAWDAVR